jgi:hypothetical protein
MRKNLLKLHLNDLNKSKLIHLIIELANLRKENLVYLEAKFAEPSELLEVTQYYKKIVQNEFYPMRGEPKMRLSIAKRAVSDFKKASQNKEAVLDLMIFYVETGTKFTKDYGDINEAFYMSMESMYGKVVSLLNKSEDVRLIEYFRPRLRAIVKNAEGTGWGYYGNLSDFYDELIG